MTQFQADYAVCCPYEKTFRHAFCCNALFGFVGRAHAADMFFLSIPGASGIPGESVVPRHAGEIDVESFSMGVVNSINRNLGGGGVGRSSFQDVTVVKPLDKASPSLVLTCAQGRHLPTVVLKVIRAGATQEEYYTVTLTDVVISSVQNSGGMVNDGSGHSTAAMSETVSLNFGRMQISYRPQGPDGRYLAPIVSGWDVARQAPL